MPKVKLRNTVAENPNQIYQVGVQEVPGEFVEKYKDSGVIEKIFSENVVEDDMVEPDQQEPEEPEDDSEKQSEKQKNKKAQTQKNKKGE